ncbi:MAG: cold shock domain-containing protein [Desulfobacterales bacterium]
MPNGIVKWFSNRKGYGFIEQKDGDDIFVHHSAINMSGFRTLSEGDRVTFEIEVGERGPAAKNVEKQSD